MLDVIKMVHELAEVHGRQVESLLPILQCVAQKYRYVPEDAMVEIARELDLSAAKVFGTATFYSFLPTKPRGKYIIRVCKTISCMMHGKTQIVDALESELKVKLGETTNDGLFTLLETNCLGQCHVGPAMLINDTPYTDLTPQKVHEIIHAYLNEAGLNSH